MAQRFFEVLGVWFWGLGLWCFFWACLSLLVLQLALGGLSFVSEVRGAGLIGRKSVCFNFCLLPKPYLETYFFVGSLHVPTNSMLGLIMSAYKTQGYGSLRQTLKPSTPGLRLQDCEDLLEARNPKP